MYSVNLMGGGGEGEELVILPPLTDVHQLHLTFNIQPKEREKIATFNPRVKQQNKSPY